MAQCVQSVQELIPDSFVPCVAALCSDEAERLTRLNHLSFAELLKPFSRLTSEGTWCPSSFTRLKSSCGREKEVGSEWRREGRRPGAAAGRGAASVCQDSALLTARFSRRFLPWTDRVISREDKLEPRHKGVQSAVSSHRTGFGTY